MKIKKPINVDVYGLLVNFDAHLAEKEGQIHFLETAAIKGGLGGYIYGDTELDTFNKKLTLQPKILLHFEII